MQTNRVRVPALDGLRSIAILGVFAYHVSPKNLSGGFTGVDVFFVLSGFLITSIILHDIKTKEFSFKEFYLRRIQRLLPNAFATIAVTILLLWFLLPVGQEIFAANQGLWTLFNASNFYTWLFHGNYWGNSAEWSFFTHFWSLGIEEQFYLLFPLPLFIAVRLLGKKLALVLALATVASFLLGLHGTFYRPTAAFYLLPMRVWELLLGATLAASGVSIFENHIAHRVSRPAREVFAWAGLALIVGAFVFPMEYFAFPGWIALLPTFGAALVLCSLMAGRSSVRSILSFAPAVGLGKISYSLYLWHWPLIILGKCLANLHGFSEQCGALAGGVAGFVFSVAAYFVVERPLRFRGGEHKNDFVAAGGINKRVRKLCVTGALFAGTCALCVFMASRPLPTFPRFDTVTWAGQPYALSIGAADRVEGVETGASVVEPGVWAAYAGFQKMAVGDYDVRFEHPTLAGLEKFGKEIRGVWRLPGGAVPRVVVLGSSHAQMYGRVVDDICREKALPVAFLCKTGDGVFRALLEGNPRAEAEMKKFCDFRRQCLVSWNPDVIFLIHRWDIYLKPGRAEEVVRDLENFLEEIRDLKSRVVFVTQAPVAVYGQVINLRAAVEKLAGSDGRLPRIAQDAHGEARRGIHEAVSALAARHPRLSVLRADSVFVDVDGGVRYAAGRKFFYADDDHLSVDGAMQVKELFSRELGE